MPRAPMALSWNGGRNSLMGITWFRCISQGWTFQKYVQLVTEYRNNFDQDKIKIPLIILGRNSSEKHYLEWITEKIISNITLQ